MGIDPWGQALTFLGALGLGAGLGLVYDLFRLLRRRVRLPLLGPVLDLLFWVVVTAGLFLLSIIFAPVVGIVPGAATAPALIFVGILMLSNIRDVDFGDMSEALPAFCTIVFMPFTYSIANGVAVGLITYCIMKLFTGKVREIQPLAAVVSLIFILRYAFMTLG